MRTSFSKLVIGSFLISFRVRASESVNAPSFEVVGGHLRQVLHDGNVGEHLTDVHSTSSLVRRQPGGSGQQNSQAPGASKRKHSPEAERQREGSSESRSPKRRKQERQSSSTSASESSSSSETSDPSAFSDWSFEKLRLKSGHGTHLSRDEIRRYKQDPTASVHVERSRHWYVVHPDEVQWLPHGDKEKVVFSEMYSCFCVALIGQQATIVGHFLSVMPGPGRLNKNSAAVHADARTVLRKLHQHQQSMGSGPLALHLISHPDPEMQQMARGVYTYLQRHAPVRLGALHMHTYKHTDLGKEGERTRSNILFDPTAPEGRRIEIKAAWFGEEQWRRHIERNRGGDSDYGTTKSERTSGEKTAKSSGSTGPFTRQLGEAASLPEQGGEVSSSPR